jgi:hypothetical protein
LSDETFYGLPVCGSLHRGAQIVVSLFKCREFAVVGCECLWVWRFHVLGVVSLVVLL